MHEWNCDSDDGSRCSGHLKALFLIDVHTLNSINSLLGAALYFLPGCLQEMSHLKVQSVNSVSGHQSRCVNLKDPHHTQPLIPVSNGSGSFLFFPSQEHISSMSHFKIFSAVLFRSRKILTG